MNTKFLLVALYAGLLSYTSQAAYADENGRAQLQKAATGQEFVIAKTTFRLVPDAVVNHIEKPETDNPAMDATARIAIVGELARVGLYSISLGSGERNRAAGKQSTSAAAGDAPYGVAMNQRSGAPVLVTRRLKVYCNEMRQANALADISGGKMVMVSAVAQLIFLEYATPAAALAAIPLLKKQACVKTVEPEIVENFAEPN
ncbi:hypothetical protein [Herbaspirillum rhizosphaerae]|uniref:hypothetical protein n=1 Tax=Herbaspirillum rhizosphaerae TaxID=346179 RepID=UPI00067D43A2|nr:hypothetical protein [Herbaspirillum rhizosphaerae]